MLRLARYTRDLITNVTTLCSNRQFFLMRANRTISASHLTVPTQNSVAFLRITTPSQIKPDRSSPNTLTMLFPIVVDMLQGQESQFVLSTADTAPTISSHYFSLKFPPSPRFKAFPVFFRVLGQTRQVFLPALRRQSFTPCPSKTYSAFLASSLHDTELPRVEVFMRSGFNLFTLRTLPKAWHVIKCASRSLIFYLALMGKMARLTPASQFSAQLVAKKKRRRRKEDFTFRTGLFHALNVSEREIIC